MKKLLLIALLGCVFGTVINVPDDYATIQGGIDASIDGDTVLVANGTYYENINFNGKNIVVQGDDRETTIIDGGQNGSVVTFESGEDSTTLLSGFTITNGLSQVGGGLSIISSNPTIRDLIVVSNFADWGGGIRCDNINVLHISNIIIDSNTATWNAGGIYISSIATCEDYDYLIFGDNGGCTEAVAALGCDYILGETQISEFCPETCGECPEVDGCMDINACNFIEAAIVDDGSCFYAEDNYDCDASSPTLMDLTITNNIAGLGAGGIYVNASNATLTDMTITNNTAEFGGGIYLQSSNVTLIHVSITNNTAIKGGGMFLNRSHFPTLNNTIISNNTGNINGGGMSLWRSDPTLTDVIISRNISADGGGMYLLLSNPILTNVSIVGNNPIHGIRGGGLSLDNSDPILTNSIIWGNLAIDGSTIFFNFSSDPFITYSDIEGDWEGNWNIDLDPLFNDPENGDYTLQEGSPCIDTGTTDLDGDGEDDITDYCGSSPDMGAYEYITEDCEECPDNIEGDTNFDGSVNILDIIIIVNCILSDSCDICFDLNGDQDLDILDIVILAIIILDN